MTPTLSSKKYTYCDEAHQDRTELPKWLIASAMDAFFRIRRLF